MGQQLLVQSLTKQSLLGWHAVLKTGGPLCRVIRETPKLVLVKFWRVDTGGDQVAIYPKESLFFWTGDASHLV